MSTKSLLNDDMDTDDGQRDSIEWLRSDFDAQPVGNLDFLISSENGIFDDSSNSSPNQKHDNQRDAEKKHTTTNSNRKHASPSSVLPQKRQSSSERLQQKPQKKQNSGKNKASGTKSTNKKGSSSSSQIADKKVRRLQAHNAAEKRRQQRIAQEIDHIREVLVRQEVTVGSTKRELFQTTVEHMNYLWNTIKEYKMKEAARPSPDDLRIAKMLKESCTQAMYEIDSNFTICHVFGACADITGHMDPKQQLSGKSFLECVHPDDVMRVRSYFRAVFDHRSYGDIETIRNVDGKKTSLETNFVMSSATFAPRIPAMLYPFQFRRKHASHSYYVPVQVNCHSLTDSVNNPELFEDGDQEKLDKQKDSKLLFSERSLIMGSSGDTMMSPKSLKKALPSSNKGVNGMKKQGLKMLRRSHTWHNPTDIFEAGNLSKRLPKIN